jgi:hypothetical protein
MRKIICLRCFAGLIFCLFFSSGKAQSFYKWFENNNVSIRKTFDGSKKDEAKPATFLLGRDFISDFRYSTIDFGLKISQIELLKNSNSPLLFYPKIEWHKDGSKKDKEKNSLSAGVNMEFFPIPAKTHVSKGWTVAPWIQGSLDYQNDYIKKVKTIKSKAYISLYGVGKGSPGGTKVRNASGALLLRYYPYSGIENYKAINGSKETATYWANRLFVELYPIAKGDKQYVQVTLDYTYRVKLKDNLYKRSNLSWFSAGLNIYPDGLGKFGFGIDYIKGDDSGDNFTVTDKITFGIKAKL